MAQYLNRSHTLHLDLRYGASTSSSPFSHGASGRSRGGSSLPGPGSRSVVVKSWMATSVTTGAHLRYLTQGKGTDGTNTTLFGAQGVVRDPRVFSQQAQADGHQFRWVVSLVDHDQLSLMRYTQALMRQVEHDVHRPLDWLASTHRDTAHVHTHIVVRGRDADGRSLYLPLQYLSRGLRARAMHLATAWLGQVPMVERQQMRTATRAFDQAMVDQEGEAKHPKEDPRMDANHPTQLDQDPSADAPPSGNGTPAQADPSSLMARLVALEGVIQQRLQQMAKSRDRGIQV